MKDTFSSGEGLSNRDLVTILAHNSNGAVEFLTSFGLNMSDVVTGLEGIAHDVRTDFLRLPMANLYQLAGPSCLLSENSLEMKWLKVVNCHDRNSVQGTGVR